MEALTLADLEAAIPGLHEVEFLGKTCFIREMDFDGQMAIANSDLDQVEKLKLIVGLSLCDKDGNLLFESTDQAREMLGKMPGPTTLELYETVERVNGLDEVETEGNLQAAP